MNKRIQFILFPALALIFSIISWQNNAVFFRNDNRQAFNIAGNSITHSVSVPGLQKENKHHVKTNIRVKAWDDAIAIAVAPLFASVITAFISSEVIYGGYEQHKLSDRFFSYGLRGPPVV